MFYLFNYILIKKEKKKRKIKRKEIKKEIYKRIKRFNILESGGQNDPKIGYQNAKSFSLFFAFSKLKIFTIFAGKLFKPHIV